MRVIYSNELEFTSRPVLMYDQFTESKGDFVAKRGERVYWTIYRHLPPAIGKLTENVDVDGAKLADFQVSFTVDEYGFAIGTTEKLNLLSYHGPISNIVRQVLAPQMALTVDILARNAFIGADCKYRSFGGTATSRSELAAGDTITETLVRKMAHNLSVRRVPLRGNGYLFITHPSVSFDVRGSNYWKEANLYAGSVNIFNGEVGMLHGCRFVECDNARLPNAGAVIAETTLNGAVSPGASYIIVADTTGFAAGQEITIYPAEMSAPDGTSDQEEHVVIDSVVAADKKLVLRSKLLLAHANGAKVREGLDIFPIVVLGGVSPVGKGTVVEPEVRVATPTDKLRRMSFVGWYALMGYGVLRDWMYECLEVTSSVTSSAPAFPW